MTRRLVGMLIAIGMLGCSPSYTVVPSATVGAPCQTIGLREAQRADPNARLAAAFVSTVADVASWEGHGYGTGNLRIANPTITGAPLTRVDVCYYEGAFTIGSHPIATAGATFRPYDVLLVTVDAGGSARIATAGSRESMPLASPAHGP